VIGRQVQNCHPPESVQVVNQILAAFKDSSKDKAEFRIGMKGRFFLIQYFALRDQDGIYKGTLEVSEDITDIRDKRDEKRLLDW